MLLSIGNPMSYKVDECDWVVESSKGRTIFTGTDPDDVAAKAYEEVCFIAAVEAKAKNNVSLQRAAKMIDREEIKARFKITSIKRKR